LLLRKIQRKERKVKEGQAALGNPSLQNDAAQY